MSCGANMAQSCRDCMEENNGLCGVVDGVWDGAWKLVEIYAEQAAGPPPKATRSVPQPTGWTPSSAGSGGTSRPKIPENSYCANVNTTL